MALSATERGSYSWQREQGVHECGRESRAVVGTETGGRRGPYGGRPCVPREGIEWVLTCRRSGGPPES